MSRQRKRSKQIAARAGLSYVNDFAKGYRRRRRGRGFSYLSTRNTPLRSERRLKRIKALAIPPAWEEVWICPQANGHIQALGVDEAGRRQYIYHARWHEVSSALKFDELETMAQVLPRIRRRVRKDLKESKLTRRRVVAAAVRLIDRAHLRVGDADNTERYGSRGVTTLEDEHVEIDGVTVSLSFPGKSQQQRDISLSDPELAEVLDQCEEVSDQFLFCYRLTQGDLNFLTSSDINSYLNQVAKAPITAKDFRTWAGTVAALGYLVDQPKPGTSVERKKTLVSAIKHAAKVLGNTPAVARSSYIHPGIQSAAKRGELWDWLAEVDRSSEGRFRHELKIDENRLAALLPRLDQLH